MRDKEIRQDYRYMPEPNLPVLRLYDKENPAPINLADDQKIDIEEIAKLLSKHTVERRKRWSENYKLTLYQMM